MEARGSPGAATGGMVAINSDTAAADDQLSQQTKAQHRTSKTASCVTAVAAMFGHPFPASCRVVWCNRDICVDHQSSAQSDRPGSEIGM
jgi:hypothetical protein